MPAASPRLCPACGGRVRGRCLCTQGTERWTRKPRSWAGGSTRAWRTFRADWLNDHPICMEPECTALATVVCHKPDIDYDRDRLNPDAIEGQRCESHDAKVTGHQGGQASGRARRTG